MLQAHLGSSVAMSPLSNGFVCCYQRTGSPVNPRMPAIGQLTTIPHFADQQQFERSYPRTPPRLRQVIPGNVNPPIDSRSEHVPRYALPHRQVDCSRGYASPIRIGHARMASPPRCSTSLGAQPSYNHHLSSCHVGLPKTFHWTPAPVNILAASALTPTLEHSFAGCPSQFAERSASPLREAGCRTVPPAWSRGIGAAANADQMEAMGQSKAGFGGLAQKMASGRSIAEASQHVQVVSLGSYCGVKITVRRLGFGDAHLPFDWMRTRVQGLIEWLRHDFDGFFDWTSRVEITQHSQRMTVYRSSVASFWHDDLQNDVDVEKLKRRVRRFQDLGKEAARFGHAARPLLFVRSVCGSSEVVESETLFKLLQEKFQVNGRRVFLLIIVEDQPLVGPILHAEHDGLFFWVQPQFDGKLSPYLDAPAPFEDAVVFAVRRILGDPSGHFPTAEGESWPVAESSSEFVSANGQFRRAGFKDTDTGIWAGNVNVNGVEDKVALAAFDGIDTLSSTPLAHVASDSLPPTLENDRGPARGARALWPNVC